MTQPTDTISVVIPVYNGMRYLVDAVSSVFRQTYAPHEIIVVDDGSSDSSADIVRQIGVNTMIPIRYVYQVNQGPAAARNQGVDLASGRLIAFLDQDDCWLPQKLARQMDLLRRQPEAGYSITLFEVMLEPGMNKPAWLRPELMANPQPGYLPSCLLLRRETWSAIGVFDPALRVGYDLDWFVRAMDAGVGVAIVPEVLVQYRVHDMNQSSHASTIQRGLLRAVRGTLLRKRDAACRGSTSADLE